MVSTKKYHSPQIRHEKCLIFFVNMPTSHIWRCPDRKGLIDFVHDARGRQWSTCRNHMDYPLIIWWYMMAIQNSSTILYQTHDMREKPVWSVWGMVASLSVFPVSYHTNKVRCSLVKWETHGDTIFFVWWCYCYIIYSIHIYVLSFYC